MAKKEVKTPYQICALQEYIEKYAGPEIREKIMEGSQEISTSTQPVKLALWVKSAVGKLDALVDEEARNQILLNCGYNCVKIHKIASKIRNHQKKYPSLDAYLEDAEKNPGRGTRLERKGTLIYQYYTPQSLTRPVRCYCHLLRHLPQDETVSLTYCQCSRGFAQKAWEALLGRTVELEILESCAAGARECKFAIYLNEGDFALTP